MKNKADQVRAKIRKLSQARPLLFVLCTAITSLIHSMDPSVLEILIDSGTFIGVVLLILDKDKGE